MPTAAVLIDPTVVHRLLAGQLDTITAPVVAQLGREEPDGDRDPTRHTVLELTPRARRAGDDTHFADFTLTVVISADEDAQRTNVYFITANASAVYAALCEFTNSAQSHTDTGHEVNVEEVKVDITEGPEIHGNAQAIVTATGVCSRVTGNSITAVP